MLLIVLFVISLFVWLGARLFEIRNDWTDIVAQVTVPIGGGMEKFAIPGFGLLIFVAVGMGILYLANIVLRSLYLSAVGQIHLKDTSHRLPIQLFGSAIHTDAMNENIDAVVAWLPPRLSKWVIGFFAYKLLIGLVLFALAVVVPLIANLFGAGDTGQLIASILKELSFALLRYAMNVNGMVLFGYAVLVTYAYSLYMHERVFIRDYAIMQKQIAAR